MLNWKYDSVRTWDVDVNLRDAKNKGEDFCVDVDFV